MRRNLAAIMVADTVGYSKMMGADEQAAFDAFSDLRQSIFEPTVNHNRGDIVKRTGDGWLVEFASVLDAVSCAISIQEELRSHETLKLRIGIHAGDLLKSVSHQVAASAGATCHSAAGVSSILRAMHVPIEFARGTVRLSLGPTTTLEQVEKAASILASTVQQQWKQAQQQK